MKRFLFPIWEELGVSRPTPQQARHYLLTHGWHEQSFGPELFVFAGPPDDEGRPIIQVLPSSDEMPAYSQRLLDLLDALCRLEARLIRDILADILRGETNGVVAAHEEPTASRRP